MVARWLRLKDRALKSLAAIKHDKPPVTVVDTSTFYLPSWSKGKVSIYHSPFTDKPTYSYGHSSSRTGAFFFVTLFLKERQDHSFALERLSREVWYDICAEELTLISDSSPESFFQSHVLVRFIERLQTMLYDIAKETLPFEYIGLTALPSIDLMLLNLSRNHPVVAISRDKTRLDLNLQPQKAHFTAQKALSDILAISVAPHLQAVRPLEHAVQAVMDIPYPVEAAAELVHFALLEHKQTSNCMWIEFGRG